MLAKWKIPINQEFQATGTLISGEIPTKLN